MLERMKCFWVCLISVLIIMVLTGWVEQVQSQEKYPTRSIDLIVPFAPGAGTDIIARLTAAYLKIKWGVPVNVINKAGGNSVPANLEVYQATPDGYTMMADSQSSSSGLEAAIRNLPFKVMDRTFTGMLTVIPNVFFVAFTAPWKNMKDIEAEVKKDPESFTWTSLGGGGGTDVVMRQFLKAINVDVSRTKPIMIRGGSEGVSLVSGGHVKVGITTTSSINTTAKANVTRVVGLTEFRSREFPDVPTFKEAGYPEVNGVYWWGVSGPPKLPSYITDKWESALREMSNDPEFVSKLEKVDAIPYYRNSSELREYVRKEIETAARLWGLK